MTATAAGPGSAALARDLLAARGRPAQAPAHQLGIVHRDPIPPTALRVGRERPRPASTQPAPAPWWLTMDSACGPLRRLGPIGRMSATPPRWAPPPAPLGSHPAEWAGADRGACR